MLDTPWGRRVLSLAVSWPVAKATAFRTTLWHLRKRGLKLLPSLAQRVRANQGAVTKDTVHGAVGYWVGGGVQRRLEFEPMVINSDQAPRNPRVRAAVILDDFSSLAFGSEWNCTQLSKRSWRDQVEDQDFNILFVESAWSGMQKQWCGKIDGENHDDSELADVVAHFKCQGIPTVFWNKEDPVHYKDFIAAARLFDYVFTTDADKISEYRRDLRHDRVGLLPFAAQQRLHNPVRPDTGWHERDVAFGGMYFSEKFESRRAQMELLLGTAAKLSHDMNHGLEIFSRQLGGPDKYQFPTHINDHVVGSLSYAQMLTAYKAYKAMFNVNTVTRSSTMCARRVFEILASGTTVISTPSKALTQLFAPGEILICATEQEVEYAIQTVVRDPRANERRLHLAQRRIWEKHTYRHRCESVLAAVLPSLALDDRKKCVTAVALLDEQVHLGSLFEMLGKQRDVDIELILVSRNFEPKDGVITELQEKFGIHEVRQVHGDVGDSRGARLNLGIAAATGEVVALIEAADYYGSHYLIDQLYALDYSAADVVGKRSYYSVNRTTGEGQWKSHQQEHRWTSEVLGSTVTARSETFLALPFAELELDAEQDFLERVTLDGGSIYSADRYNYLRIVPGRGSPPASKITSLSDLSMNPHKIEVTL